MLSEVVVSCLMNERRLRFVAATAVAAITALVFVPRPSVADEGGVSFWLPGIYGSLAAAPQQPGWSLATIYYHTSVSAGGDVGIARERELGNIPVNVKLAASLNANVSGPADLGLAMLNYTLPTPVLGGQATFG